MTADDERPEQRPELHPETRAITAGRADNDAALAPILWATSTFTAPDLDEGARVATASRPTRFYSPRYGNPTVRAFEDAVAELEGAGAGLAFGSGMGAVSSVVLALCSKGDHVVVQRQLFQSSVLLFTGVCPRFGIDVTVVDGTDSDAIAAAVEPGRTVLLFVETPANPVLQLVDLAAVGAITGPIKVVDSTFAGPFVQRPLEHGFDLVVHSATKGLAGHNDATLGVAVGAADLIDWVWRYSTVHGAAASPFDAMNGLRGLRTLAVRLRQQTETAQRLAETLEAHPAVALVHYPGLASHPQRDLATRQMAMPGGVLSFDLAGGLDAARHLASQLRLARLAPSLGGPETLVTHPATTTAVGLLPDEREQLGVSDGLIRVSCGLEHTDDVVADIVGALPSS